MKLSELVIFMHEDHRQAMAAVKRAVRWLYQKPEGKDLLLRARTLHGQPITVIADYRLAQNGFAEVNSRPVILVNPKELDVMPLIATDGSIIPQHSLERLLSHEFTHAAQPNAFAKNQEIAAIKAKLIEECYPAPPFELYKKRLEAAADDEQLSKILREMYDTHMADKVVPTMKEATRRVGANPLVQQFVAEYEVPALEFENFMATKYLGEKPRTLDYLNSGSVENISIEQDRENFVVSALSSIKEARAAKNAASTPLDPREIRPDAGPRLSGDNSRL